MTSVLFVLGMSICHSEVIWDQPLQTFSPKIEDKTVTADYQFQNKDSHSITFTDIKTSCGCTVAELDKKTYAAGEKGIVHVIYTIGNQGGVQMKSIMVATDDVRHPNYTLLLRAYVPEVLKIFPKYLVWALGAKPDPKIITVKAMPSLPVKILSVFSNSLSINAQLKVEHEGTAYTILVTPTGTQSEARGTLVIESDLQQDGQNRKFFAYADVRPQSTAHPVTNH